MEETKKGQNFSHFQGKEAVTHVAEAQAQGILSSAESHGTEIPGHLSAGSDSARETALLLLLLWIAFQSLTPASPAIFPLLIVFSLAWALWKTGRSAWLAWFRLERMHRIVEQERWEIQHHRGQERVELKELYRAKGLEGKLLEDVIDVLMADEDRLLRVMVEEELCLKLSAYEHPLKQAIGAAAGSFLAAFFCLICLFVFPATGLWFASFVILAVGAGIAAHFEGNRLIPAIVWNLGLGALAAGACYFLLQSVTLSLP